MLWDIYQQVQIQNLAAQQRLTSSRVDNYALRHGRRADDAEDDLLQLVLITQAMFELMQERLGITSEELLARIREIDERDGAADGRATATPQECASCGAKVPVDRDTCQFCGAAAGSRDPFAG